MASVEYADTLTEEQHFQDPNYVFLLAAFSAVTLASLSIVADLSMVLVRI